MDKKSKQIESLRDILNLKGVIKNNYDDYENTRSLVSFVCDKGHNCLASARNLLYSNVGCKTCQYEKKKSILNIELTDTEFKICNCCNEKKNRTYYGKLTSSNDGLRQTCKLCRRKKNLSKCDDTIFIKNMYNFIICILVNP